jgi:general secretion pathway protein G
MTSVQAQSGSTARPRRWRSAIALTGAACVVLVGANVSHGRTARVDQARMDMNVIEQGLKAHYIKRGHYPDPARGLETIVTEQYLDKLPDDPWGSPYFYALEGNRPVITSAGPDRRLGCESDDIWYVDGEVP